LTRRKRTEKRKNIKSRLGDLLLEEAVRRKNQSRKSVPVVRIHPQLHQRRPLEPRAQIVINIQDATLKKEVVQHAKIIILHQKARHEDDLARILLGRHCHAHDLLQDEDRRLIDDLYLEEGLDRQTVVTRAHIGNL